MDLYVVVHHRDDPDQPWANAWVDVERLGAITTTAEIGRFCTDEKLKGKRVFAHRCSYGSQTAVVACSLEVEAVTRLPGGAYVQFKDAVVVNRKPPIKPPAGTNSYYL